jgi:hypothetical protein
MYGSSATASRTSLIQCPDCDFEHADEDVMACHCQITQHTRPLTQAEQEEAMVAEWREFRKHVPFDAEDYELRTQNLEEARAVYGTTVSEPTLGQVAYNNVTREAQVWNGSQWIPFGHSNSPDRRRHKNIYLDPID